MNSNIHITSTACPTWASTLVTLPKPLVNEVARHRENALAAGGPDGRERGILFHHLGIHPPRMVGRQDVSQRGGSRQRSPVEQGSFIPGSRWPWRKACFKAPSDQFISVAIVQCSVNEVFRRAAATSSHGVVRPDTAPRQAS
jgi:hypothetical protein